MSHRILIIEDDHGTVELAALYLRRDGHTVIVAHDGREGFALAQEVQPDLIVLDLMLPGMHGLDVCRAIRESSSVPIIMLTARADEQDRLVGLDSGADDYLTKPFSPRELAARVRAVLRRSTISGNGDPDELRHGPVTVDPRARTVTAGNVRIALTPTEFRLLTVLMRAPGRVFTRDEILSRAFDDEFLGVDRNVDAHVASIRRKLAIGAPGHRVIQTVYGAGYRLTDA